MKKKFVFNGKYMCKKQCRGVQRYTKEVLHALDMICEAGEYKIIIPHKVEFEDEFINLEVVKFGGFFTSKLWQFLGFQLYLLLNRSFAVCLSDGIPLINIGVVAIHDVRYLDDISKVYGKRKMQLCFVKMNFDRAVKRAMKIVTVSNFSKKEIIKKYNMRDTEKIEVCYNSWQHLDKIGFQDDIFRRHNNIIKGNYYFTLGGSEESKNMYWILKMVQKYPERQFVMAGPRNFYFPSENVNIEDYSNFCHLGYVTDEELKSLMKNCRLFLFPSKYEGFGIPPMEAISTGAKVAVSNATSLPEIYKNYVAYFDPDDYDVDLDFIENQVPENIRNILNEYSWDFTANKIRKILKRLGEE